MQQVKERSSVVPAGLELLLEFDPWLVILHMLHVWKKKKNTAVMNILVYGHWYPCIDDAYWWNCWFTG